MYEIDLKTFSAEEFLDLTNPGVKATVASAAFQGSLPRCRVVLLDVVVSNRVLVNTCLLSGV